MDVSGDDNWVLAMDVARPGQDLLVVTENGYGKRSSVDEYRLTSRGAKGVKTITFVESKGLLAAALVVREHQELVFISQNGMVQRTSVRGINRYGRASQGVRVMNLRAEDEVSAVALVQETEAATAAPVAGNGGGPLAGPDEIAAAQAEAAGEGDAGDGAGPAADTEDEG
jgi:DNA gyrase subunit A